ncbi:MAG: AAA family ATPase [Caulobacteraceae bacterium]|nr:AAA family ATPase [Caulobacteraceae bacterium]
MGAAEITEIRRQREDWQRDATRELATGRTGAALERYEAAGMVHAHDTARRRGRPWWTAGRPCGAKTRGPARSCSPTPARTWRS